MLTHWGRVKHLCVDNENIIGSDNDLSPGRRKRLSEPLLTLCQLNPWERISVKFCSKSIHFHSRKCISKSWPRNGSHFVSASMRSGCPYWFHCCHVKTIITPAIIIPAAQRSCLGSIGFTPFARPSSRVRSVAPTVLVGSISCLYILSSNFRRCVLCKGSCKNSDVKFLAFFLICNFDFVLFWLGNWCESLVWAIMGGGG